MTKYVSGIVQRASPNVGEGRIRPAGRSLGTPAISVRNCNNIKIEIYNIYI